MHQTAARGTSFRSLRRSGLVAFVVAALSVSSVVLSAGAGAARLSPHAGPGLRAGSTEQPCPIVGSDEQGYFSACFPELQMVIAWNGFNAEGKDIGSEVGDQSVRFLVFNHTIEVTTEQSSSFGAHDQIMSQLSAEPACDADATPPYSGTGDGGDGFLAWQDGVPTSHSWGPNVAPFSVSLPNCDGGTIPVSYEPGTPLLGDKCPADPRQSPRFDLYYGKLSQSGTLAKGIRDTWDFDCTFTPNNSWKSSGTFTMDENSCPRMENRKGMDHLRPSTRKALDHLYQSLEEIGGCFQFKRGWTSPRTHAQNANIIVGFRPVGLNPFITTEDLRQYIVPVLRPLAAAAGLCGPTKAHPVHYQTPYKTAKEKKPSCHLG